MRNKLSILNQMALLRFARDLTCDRFLQCAKPSIYLSSNNIDKFGSLWIQEDISMKMISPQSPFEATRLVLIGDKNFTRLTLRPRGKKTQIIHQKLVTLIHFLGGFQCSCSDWEDKTVLQSWHYRIDITFSQHSFKSKRPYWYGLLASRTHQAPIYNR